MSLDYIYYQAVKDSPAFNAIIERIRQTKVRNEWAKTFAAKVLPGVDVGFIVTDTTLMGFAPNGDSTWTDFRKHVDLGIWIEQEDRQSRWIRPRAKVKDNPAWAAIIAEWLTRPSAMSMDALSTTLFGMDRFCRNLRMSSMCAYWNHETHVFIVGVPWLATKGLMEGFGRGSKFTLCEGLKKMPYEKAMMIIHEDDLAKKNEPAKKADGELW